MPKEEIFVEPESSSDEEDPIVDGDTCSKFEIENAFPVKYKIADECAVSLKKVYILRLCGNKSFNRIAAGLSNNCVQIFDMSSNQQQTVLRPYKDALALASDGAICGVRFLDDTGNILLVGSTNGDVGLYDLRTGMVQQKFEDRADCTKKPITSFDVNANDRYICIGTEKIKETVYLMFFDVRQNTIMGSYWECHQDDVSDIKFHPTNPNLMCTGSIDGLINVFDISANSEDDALTSTFNTENSVHKLNWHKDVYEKDIISCITDSNDFNSYECEESDLVAKFERVHITEAMKRKSASDCNLISCHNLADGGMFLLAASNYNKGEVVRSMQLKNKNLVPHGEFDGNKQIIRESIYEPQSNLLVTAGESGIITLWSPLTADQPAPKSGLNHLKVKSKRSHAITPY